MVQFLSSRLVREGGWVAVGQILGAIAALVSTRIMTELLAPDQFGQLTLLVGAGALALGLVSNPRLQAVIRYYPDWSTSERVNVLRATAKQLIYRLVFVTAIVLAAGGAATAGVFIQPWYTGILIAALLLVDTRREFELAFLNAARRQRPAAMVQLADAWSRPLLAIASVLVFGHTAEAALLGYVMGSALVLFAMRLSTPLDDTAADSLVRSLPVDSDRTALALAIKRYALPLAPLVVFGWLSGMGDRYAIAALLGMDDVGLYAAAYGLASRPFLMLSAVIEQTLRPVLQDAIAKGETSSIRSVKRRMIQLSVLGSVCGVFCFIALSDFVAHLFLAKEYRSTATMMPWIALGYAFLTVSSMYSRFCYALDATRYVLLLTVAASTVGLAILVPAALMYGLMGAVAAVPIRFAVELILSAFFARRAERSHAK